MISTSFTPGLIRDEKFASAQETDAMAKGQMRSSKEKKKPKQDKEKKKGTSAYAQAYHAQQSSSPIGKKE
jgi:hypothetical protein